MDRFWIVLPCLKIGSASYKDVYSNLSFTASKLDQVSSTLSLLCSVPRSFQ